MRERGLKSHCVKVSVQESGRSREGAWIEIWTADSKSTRQRVAPVRERGLKYRPMLRSNERRFVAPVRERGLK